MSTQNLDIATTMKEVHKLVTVYQEIVNQQYLISLYHFLFLKFNDLMKILKCYKIY